MRQFLAGFSPVPERSTKRKTFYIFTRKIFDNRKKISYNKNTVRTEPIRRQCDGLQKYPRGSRGSPAKGVASVTVARVQISSSAPKTDGQNARPFLAWKNRFDGQPTPLPGRFPLPAVCSREPPATLCQLKIASLTIYAHRFHHPKSAPGLYSPGALLLKKQSRTKSLRSVRASAVRRPFCGSLPPQRRFYGSAWRSAPKCR